MTGRGGRALGPAPPPIAAVRGRGYDHLTMGDGATVTERERLAELRGSAKGWHTVQLAALGFVGLCGVLESADDGGPRSLQVLAGVLILVSFALALGGIYLVGRAAWPLYRGDPAAGGAAEISATGARVRRGLALTFASIAALTLATATAWWPSEAGEPGTARVQVRTAAGQTACGELVASSRAGALRLVAAGGAVDVALDAVASVAPTGRC